jgi:serine/threonine protein phosphatase 1
LLEDVAPRPDDQLITLGDYVDRGPDSRGVLDLLIPLHQSGQLIALRGNHDVMMVDARKGEPYFGDWMRYGGREALASYGVTAEQAHLRNIPDEHWGFLEKSLVDWYEIDTHFFVHAQVDPDMPLDQQPTYLLHWEPLFEPRPHCSGKVMVCGHTSQKSGKPRNWGHAICIDTWVYGNGWLTCLDVQTGEFWQANRNGQSRIGLTPSFGERI